ncbi:ACP phosphodiesterase [Saccharospirillum alexandrii]|uniref:acyl carrier protein phosphodiesterase n=1 Tax=Saccharospirillum alexandrii TaxID=2448477 RepID=UPI000FD8D6A3|nr:acyl carrier protein phosphodiesterase [Saccharospirillum alexandrii]
MNFLGHWLFSDPTPDALIGSLWPDFARRPDPNTVSDEFLIHFDRHQAIDKLTDTTPLLEPLRVALRPKLRKTTPVVVDMLIDHHLAKHWSDYHDEPLTEFTQQRYRLAQQFNVLTLPERLERTLHFMQRDDWLAAYKEPEHLVRALGGMSRRIKFENSMQDFGLMAIETADSQAHHIFKYLSFLKSDDFTIE